MKKFKPLEPAPWARKEERRKLRQEMNEELGHKVRFIFVVLLLSTILVFAHNHYVQLQEFVSQGTKEFAKKATVQDRLREKAMSHENEINQAGQSAPNNQSNQSPNP
jgi:hypothetical protein